MAKLTLQTAKFIITAVRTAMNDSREIRRFTGTLHLDGPLTQQMIISFEHEETVVWNNGQIIARYVNAELDE